MVHVTGAAGSGILYECDPLRFVSCLRGFVAIVVEGRGRRAQ